MEKGGSIYIITNKNRTTLYIGVTSDLRARIQEHKDHIYERRFSKRYDLEFLIYYESYSTILEAIGREKQIKK